MEHRSNNQLDLPFYRLSSLKILLSFCAGAVAILAFKIYLVCASMIIFRHFR